MSNENDFYLRLNVLVFSSLRNGNILRALDMNFSHWMPVAAMGLELVFFLLNPLWTEFFFSSFGT